MKLSQKKLEARIVAYLSRAEQAPSLKEFQNVDDPAKLYPLNHIGDWRVVGGQASKQGDQTHKYEIEQPFIHGRFIDAVAYAVQQKGYFGWFCDNSLDHNCNGYIEPYTPKIVALHPDRNLDKRVKELTAKVETESA